MWKCFLSWLQWRFHSVYTYTLNVCSFLHFNYVSLSFFKKRGYLPQQCKWRKQYIFLSKMEYFIYVNSCNSLRQPRDVGIKFSFHKFWTETQRCSVTYSGSHSLWIMGRVRIPTQIYLISRSLCHVLYLPLKLDSPSESSPNAQEERDELMNQTALPKPLRTLRLIFQNGFGLGVGESYIMIITVILAQTFNPTTDC